MQVMEKADKNFKQGGTSMTNQLLMVRPQGPLAYTTYDFLKQWSWMISFTKFLAHIFTLPLMVFLRRGFGMRYVDEVHIVLSFIIWQFIGTFNAVTTGDGTFSYIVAAVVNILGFAFVPMAIYHRRRARLAAIQGEGYSYYPGLPLAFWVKVLRVVSLGRFKGEQVLIQGHVRRFGEPLMVALLGLLVAGSGHYGLAVFLLWTASMLNVNETLTQREGWEQYLDSVDAQVMAQEKERMLNEGSSGVSLTHGLPMVARVATPAEMRGKKVA